MLKIKRAGLTEMKRAAPADDKTDITLEDIGERVKKILGIFNSVDKNDEKMIYFVMYDIEHDKIRTQIARYLLKKGCTRVQKSIFLANSDRKMFDEIQQTLKGVQEMYENNDSIFFVPVSTDEIRAMKVIGKSVDFDLITRSKNTLFF